MTAAENYAVGAPLKRFQDKHGIDAAGAGNADNFDVGRIAQTAGTREIRPRVRAPVTAERHDIGGIFFLFRRYILHIASTSDMICLELNPLRSIAPEGQVTVQAPQP